MATIEAQLKSILIDAVKRLFDLELEPDSFSIEIPKNKEHGDFATNIAMQLTRKLRRNPREIATELVEQIKDADLIDQVSIAGPGFINLILKQDKLTEVIGTILNQKDQYGQQPANHIKVNLEYVSANPTGKLHLGHARGAAWGDSCARLLKKAGYEVTREYYVNDAGNQIANLALSLHARYREALNLDFTIGQDGYAGEDVKLEGQRLAQIHQDKYVEPTEENLALFRRWGIDFELAKIKQDLDMFRVHFDVWTSEQALRDSGAVEEVLNRLQSLGYLYEQDGALWFESSRFKDDKDRVLRKQDGSLTYLVPDIAYHHNKYERQFDQLVDFFGADHHGYIPRLKAAMEALGHDSTHLDVDIIQMVRLMSEGQEVKMSKRTGNAVTIEELCQQVGVDAVRYFFVSRALDSHLDFDMELATKKSNENPVYYAQYAHARMVSIQKQAEGMALASDYSRLTHEKEIDLMKVLQNYPRVIQSSAAGRQVHKLCHYVQDLASHFHSFYSSCRCVNPEDPDLSSQRLALVKASQIVLADCLNLIGVQAIESM